MKTLIALSAALLGILLAGCASDAPAPSDASASATVAKPDNSSRTSDSRRRTVSTANSVNAYKLDLANRIAAANSSKMYPGRPQALLRSVVVVKYVIDDDGNLVRSEIMRSNKDRTTESTALASLRSSAPFPKPAAHLLKRGHLEISETWLFNNDGRFQLRTTAQRQMDR